MAVRKKKNKIFYVVLLIVVMITASLNFGILNSRADESGPQFELKVTQDGSNLRVSVITTTEYVNGATEGWLTWDNENLKVSDLTNIDTDMTFSDDTEKDLFTNYSTAADQYTDGYAALYAVNTESGDTVLAGSEVLYYEFENIQAGSYTFTMEFRDICDADGNNYDASGKTISTTYEIDHIHVDENDDGICDICSETVRGNLALSAAGLSLKSNTNIKIYVTKEAVYGYKNYGVKAIRDSKETKLDFLGETSDGTCYVYQLSGISAKEYACEYTFKAYGTYSGNSYSGKEQVYSVKQYCMNKLAASSSSDELKTVCADILNYGSEAQEYFDFETDNLVNKDMTEAMQGYATKDDPEVTNYYSKTSNGQTTSLVNFTAAALVLKDTVDVNIYFTENGCDASDLIFKIWVDKNANDVEDDGEVTEIDGRDYTFGTSEDQKIISVNTIPAKNMRAKIRVSAYKDFKPVSDVLTYSIESYCASKYDSTESIGSMVKMLMKYVDSAAQYFKSK